MSSIKSKYIFTSSNFVFDPGLITFAVFFCKINVQLSCIEQWALSISIYNYSLDNNMWFT